MKERTLIYLSLVVSILTLGYAVWLHQHAEQMATEALRKREREIVTHYAPKVRTVYLDIVGKTNAFPQNPQTLEELLSPLVFIVEQSGELPEAPKKETPK